MIGIENTNNRVRDKLSPEGPTRVCVITFIQTGTCWFGHCQHCFGISVNESDCIGIFKFSSF